MRSLVLVSVLTVATVVTIGTSRSLAQDIAPTQEQIARLLVKAKAGNAKAQERLGDLYDNGEGVPQDFTQAANWYRKAANQGDPLAQFALGTMYFAGDGVPRDPIQAATWYRKAAMQGNSNAQFELGSLYQFGVGVPQNYAQSVFWRLKAAEQGNAQAQSYVGFAYKFGEGVTQNDAQAAFWYRKAAEQGNADGQTGIGSAYKFGHGVPQNDGQAALWFRKAADQGDALGEYFLGELYADGEGIPQDNAQAVFWYRKAADQGDVDARKALAKLQGTVEMPVPQREQQDHTLPMSSRDIAQRAFKSVVLLEMNDANGQPLSLGSGFFISDGIIATNAHVIKGSSSGTAKLVGDNHTMQILGAVAVDHNADLALLKVDSPAPPLALGQNTSPAVGDNVYVVGNPLGLEGTFSEGIISGLRHVDADTILQMTAPISPGSSGGPVMDSSGAVIGIAVGTFEDGQNLNLAVPVSCLYKLLASPSKDIIPLGTQKLRDQAAKSMLDGLGTKTEDGVAVSNYQLWEDGEYQLRLTNKLPVAVANIDVLFLYYDASGSLMDFEKVGYCISIPAGLTKTIVSGKTSCSFYQKEEGSDESKRAGGYYNAKKIDQKVEVRVIGFSTEKTQ